MGFKKLSIIIPVYNEEKTIKQIILKVLKSKPGITKEIIFIDDGSTDRSAEIIKKFVIKRQDMKYFKKKNEGKGSAIRLGFSKAAGDIMIVQDAVLEYDPDDYKKLIKPILSGKFDVVYGSRYLSDFGHLKENNHVTFKIHKLGNNFLSLLTSILYFHKLTDMETCYKMFTRNAYKKIKLNSAGFEIEPEITAKFLKSGIKIAEVPIKYFSRDFSEGKKITWKDGVKAAFYLLKYRFV